MPKQNARPRFAILGLWHETNTFSEVPADYAAFEADALLRGEQIRAEYRDSSASIGGFLEAAASLGFEPVLLLHARTGPIGLITANAFERILGEMLALLRAQGPFDAVLLANHGAAVAEGTPDVDTEIARRVRAEVGPAVPVGMALDLHGNLNPALCRLTTVITVYQTNPHLDAATRAALCAELIWQTVQGRVQPVQWLETPPLVINIVRQYTGEEPMRALITDATARAAGPGLLTTSVVQGYPYADVAEMGMSFLAVSDGNVDLARSSAQAMARLAWRHREDMRGDIPTPRQALEHAARAGGGPVLLMDVGDNIGGGSAADSTVILAEARRLGVRGILQSLYDPEAVRACDAAGVGAQVSLTVGAKTDRRHGEPLQVTGRVLATADGRYEDPTPTHGGFRYFDDGRRAVLRTDEGNTLLLTSNRSGNYSLQQMVSVGIDPRAAAIVVAKGVVAPRAAYAPIAVEVVLVDTPGVTSANLATFDYRHRRRPLYPFEPEARYP